jgi:hypothetical protein
LVDLRSLRPPLGLVVVAVPGLRGGNVAMSADRLIVVEPGLVAVDPRHVIAVVSLPDGAAEIILEGGQAVEVVRTVDEILLVLCGDVVAPEDAVSSSRTQRFSERSLENGDAPAKDEER